MGLLSEILGIIEKYKLSNGLVAGKGGGKDDKIEAVLSDGEYVIDAETVALLGDGSTTEGAKKLDQFRERLRKEKGKFLAKGKLTGKSGSVHEYLGE